MAKISIKIASKGLNQFNLSSNHGTTSDFGQIQVSHFLPVVPNDKISCSLFSEARFAPMVVPTFMDCKLITRAFYVPMSAIYYPFENFYTDKQDATAFKTLPSISNADLVSYFQNQNGTNLLMRRLAGNDTALPDVVDGVNRYLFTEKGRLLLKLFESLGYSINWTSSDTTSFSVLPLLAFARVAYDYIYPSQYLDGLGLTKYFKITSSSDLNDCFGNSNAKRSFFDKLLVLLTLPYRQDYFTASWQNINKPGLAQGSLSLSTDPNNNHTVGFIADNIGTFMQSASAKFTQYQVNLMSRLYDFVTRNNIVGTRFADQLFAKFGIGSRQSDPDMSQFIGQTIQPIRVVDVTAMTSAEGQDLGDLGGKAFINGQDNLYHFNSIDEFGYIICLSFVMPEIGYYQGRKRWTTQQGRFDFYNPEFDMQMRAIRNDELFADFKNSADYASALNYGGTPSNRFSFAPNYSEYKKGDDYLTGDFRLPSLSQNLKPYFMLRDLPTPSSENPLALNADFLFMKQHEFDKIFAQPYVLRIPLSLREFDQIYGSVVYIYGEPLVLFYDTNHDVLGENAVYWILCLHPAHGFYVQPFLLSQLSALGVDTSNFDGAQAYEVYLDAQNHPWFIIEGQKFYLLNYTGSAFGDLTKPTEIHYFTDTNVQADLAQIPYEKFLSYFQDYIDHIYLKHQFKITAMRSMVTISDEFMIQDGGKSVGVDMNGNRIV